MEITRGDVVTLAVPGDFGKPRPAVVVQSGFFNPTHSSVVVCPVTTHLLDAPLFRVSIDPRLENGLKRPSQVMVDKIQAVRRGRIGRFAGRLNAAELARVDRALRLWLDLT
jgi:mRNA interferase MazF